MHRSLTAGLLWLVCAAGAHAQEYPQFEMGGLLFGDLYHVSNHHTDEGDGATGAVLRRGYLTFDAAFNELWDGRLRFELNQDGEFESYGFELDVKDLWVSRKIGRHEMVLGLAPSVTFSLIESIWDLRYLARTPMDMQGVASRDTGIAFNGPLNSSGTLQYNIMLGTGIEFGAEAGDGRKLMTSVAWQPSENLYIEWYADYEKLAGETDRTTGQLFAGYKTDELRWGVQYSNQDRQEDPPLELASAFVVKTVRDDWSLIGRVDRIIEPSPKGDNISYIPFDPSAPATMFLGGVEFGLTPTLKIIPNILTIDYDRNDQGVTPDSDVHLRLTFFLDLE